MAPETESALALLTDIAIWSALLPLSIGMIRFKRAEFGLKAIIILVGIMLITDNLLNQFGNSKQFSLYLPRIYTLLEFTAISLFFLSITSRKQIRTVMMIMFIPFTAIVVFDFITGGLAKRDDLSVGIESLLFIVYSLATLYFILHDAEYANIMATTEFWIISSILLYFGGSVFVFISSNYMASISRDTYVLFWGIHAAIELIFYSILAIGLWKVKESQ